MKNALWVLCEINIIKLLWYKKECEKVASIVGEEINHNFMIFMFELGTLSSSYKWVTQFVVENNNIISCL